MATKATGEEKEGDLEYHWKALNEEVEWPSLEAIVFALTVSTALNH